MYNQNCHDMKLSIENVQIISFQSIMLQLTNIMKLHKVLKETYQVTYNFKTYSLSKN